MKESTDDLHNLGVQGPASREILSRIVWTPPAQTPFAELKWFRFSIGRLGGPQGLPLIASRTGYSGELGYELFCHPKDAPALYDAVMEAGAPDGIAPLGLEALDILRIEAGLIFAGYEFDDQVDPFEAGIGFTVTADKDDDFVGRDALLERRAHPQRVLVGLELEGNETAGHGDCVHIGRSQIGVITSGTRSPILKKNIALCRIAVQHAELGTEVEVGKLDGHQKRIPATVVRFPVLRPREAAPTLVIDRFSEEQVAAFDRDGFVIVEEGLVSPRALDLLRERYEPLFQGVYETGIKPDEVNWVPGRDPEDRTRQICNGWRADTVIAAQVLSERTGRLGAQLARYRGTRILQDNVLWKPPGTKAIGFHQDSSYADYLVPAEMLTCWISLHETTADAGPIEYVRGSHLWARSPPERSQFHAPEDWLAPARNAAPDRAELDLVPVVVKPGGGSFHHGLTWHGSAPNTNASSHGWRSSPTCCRSRCASTRRTSTSSTRATGARATSRSTSRSSRCSGTRPGIGRRGSPRCRRSTDPPATGCSRSTAVTAQPGPVSGGLPEPSPRGSPAAPPRPADPPPAPRAARPASRRCTSSRSLR